MAKRAPRAVAVLVVLVVLALVPGAFAQAPVLPPGAVARVGDRLIAETTFGHWFDIASAMDKGYRRRDYVPPNFTRCIAKKRQSEPGLPRGRPPTTKSRRRAQCRREYEALRDQTLKFLILERWVSGEAQELGVVVSADEQEREFQEAKEESFASDAEFGRFLKNSRMTLADARFQIAFNTLYLKLRERAMAAGAAPVTHEEVRAFYEKHANRFARPETRDVRVVLARTRAGALAARRALERGQSWRIVARRYSIDRVSRSSGGRLLGIAEGTMEEALDEALFRAPKGKLRGPVKAQFGYYVFKVLKITPARQQTLAQSSPAILVELTAERQRASGDKFDADLRAKWKPRTVCAAEFVTSSCAGTPDPAPD